ncbi:hypothetical protein [Leptolyngbya sp. KIOST-1]|uniref:hypothetical protein n=1 Tax=Leptolyngbya sp. KIOST-1 TaxID=1229172 RepID=UPI0012E07933|nr:hypothetical protein [Leptolyngbya sp. KIOST-1]
MIYALIQRGRALGNSAAGCDRPGVMLRSNHWAERLVAVGLGCDRDLLRVA